MTTSSSRSRGTKRPTRPLVRVTRRRAVAVTVLLGALVAATLVLAVVRPTLLLVLPVLAVLATVVAALGLFVRVRRDAARHAPQPRASAPADPLPGTPDAALSQ